MDVKKIREDVWKFKGRGSVYLIMGKTNILIDAGDSMDREFLAREISKIISPERIDVVLLTHLHYDHLGCIDLFSGAEIFASKEEIEDYMENARGFHFYANEKADEILRQKIRPLPNRIENLEVLKVPGHTRGSVAFLDKKRKILFSGDTIFSGEIIGRTDLPSSVPESMSKSVRMLRNLVSSKRLLLCPGHGY